MHLRFGSRSTIKFEAHFILRGCASDQNKGVNEKSRREIHKIFPLSFSVLSSSHSSLLGPDLSRCDFVTFQHFLSCSFRLRVKLGGGVSTCSCIAVITRLSLSPPSDQPSPLNLPFHIPLKASCP